jgi:hypothetical protein
MGVALRRAGVQDRQLGGCSTFSVHPSSDMHFINASQLANSLAHVSMPGLGTVEKITVPEAVRAHWRRLLPGLLETHDGQRGADGRPHRRVERLPLLGEVAARMVLLARL